MLNCQFFGYFLTVECATEPKGDRPASALQTPGGTGETLPLFLRAVSAANFRLWLGLILELVNAADAYGGDSVAVGVPGAAMEWLGDADGRHALGRGDVPDPEGVVG